MSQHPATRLPNTVKDDLTPEPPADQALSQPPTRRSRRRPESVAKHRESLASSADEVWWGLPPEYQQAVTKTLDDQLVGVRVNGAAHGIIGSSQAVFRTLTGLLCRLLAGGIPIDEAQLWHLYDNADLDDLRSRIG